MKIYWEFSKSDSALKRILIKTLFGKNSYLFPPNVSVVNMDLYRSGDLPYHITVRQRIDLNVVQLVVCYAFDRVQDVIIIMYYVRVYTVLCSTQTFTTVNCRTGGDFYAWKTGGGLWLRATWHFSHGVSSA